MILSVFQKCLVYNQACPKLGVPSCLETPLHLRVHLKEEKKNQEGKEMGIDYEMAVQTASYHS